MKARTLLKRNDFIYMSQDGTNTIFKLSSHKHSLRFAFPNVNYWMNHNFMSLNEMQNLGWKRITEIEALRKIPQLLTLIA